MTIEDVIAKLKSDLAFRTPNLQLPLGHIVLPRVEAELLLEFCDTWIKVDQGARAAGRDGELT